MNDQFELFCIEKLGYAGSLISANSDETDNVKCSCADYLSSVGYKTLSK